MWCDKLGNTIMGNYGSLRTTAIYTMMRMLRCDWSLPMIYKSTDTWMTSGETCFLCFVQHGAWL